jgi:hypothetical protein
MERYLTYIGKIFGTWQWVMQFLLGTGKWQLHWSSSLYTLYSLAAGLACWACEHIVVRMFQSITCVPAWFLILMHCACVCTRSV